MKALLCKSFGPPEHLVLEDGPSPVPGPGEVVVSVMACGINFLDGLIIEGKYQTKPPFPFSPGAEISGIIRAVGDGVSGLAPGMRVLGFPGSGGLAEEAKLASWQVFPIPDTMDFVTAAGFLVTYGTSYHALKDSAALQPGETLLVLGAAGGVGLTAVELGKLMGARVIAAASTPEKLALCREHGADEVIDYSAEDLRGRLKDLTGGKGVDVVYDPVGGRFAELGVRSLAWKGRFLVIGFAAGDIPKIPLNLLLLKEASIVGVLWGLWAQRDATTNAANVAQLVAWNAEGKLRPHISATFPLERGGDAISHVSHRKVLGKVVVVTDPASPDRRAAV